MGLGDKYFSKDKILEAQVPTDQKKANHRKIAMDVTYVQSFHPGKFHYVRMKSLNGLYYCPVCTEEMSSVDKTLHLFGQDGWDDEADFWCWKCNKGTVLMRYKKFKRECK